MFKQSTLTVSLLLLANAAMAAPIEPQMVTIKAGEFVMGSARAANTQPAHSVTLKAFRIGKYEVSAAEFQRFVEATGYKAPRMCLQMASKRWFTSVPNEFVDAATLQSLSKFEPATCIGWNGAQAYVAWLAKETGKPYRLPSEAEWEYASRAGGTARYFFGNEETAACRYANLADRSAEAAIRRDFDGLESREHVGVMPCDDKSGYASIVGMYEANAFGLHDTLGNIAEYVQDCEHESYAGAPADGSAWVDATCKARVVRGGSWHWRGFHASHRGAMPVDFIGALEGFRVAQDIGAAASADAAPSSFDLELAEAQKSERARRAALAAIARPKG
ncbi:formylglycine-generating enzyme family protein [Massilia rubra]|uniref:Formylglycine-generating enzyme family protein n=1 Tax=Massilia rubra TaxID=2607910 RepID=A0ABX0LJS3_9BURK|nr:SUMF1/EgtB/PvdO family nonheme iron enzyme [Massilia rubra]NHZ34542.1 formylglycine-generating enzyme family protein [Massilia rubra]